MERTFKSASLKPVALRSGIQGALLYTLSNDSAWLITVQLLDGVGAGIWSVLTPLVVADLMRGTGRYNLALGGVATAQGVGASLSGLAVGLIVDHFGYDAAFATSAAVALSALAVLGFALPETGPRSEMQASLALTLTDG